MKKDTLRFELKINEDKIGYKAAEILEQILEQKQNFIERFNYEPEYISMKDDINNFLFEKLISNDGVIDIEKNYKYSPKTLYNMKIISRFEKDNIYVKDNEAICI